jgi:dipeptidyl aminopeptidase/acylaminoacyl peptidase
VTYRRAVRGGLGDGASRDAPMDRLASVDGTAAAAPPGAAASPAQLDGAAELTRPGRPAEGPRPNGDNGRARRPARDGLTIEQAAAIEAPREFRLSPDGRRVAFTAEAVGARQVLMMPVRGGYPEQLTATEKSASDPQWSPDGRRIAFVRDGAIWMIDVEGSHQALVTQHPAGNRSPRWSADGHQIAFVSRRRGWDQLWVIDAPVPRRGRPAARPRSPEPTPLTSTGVDVDDYTWSPDGRSIAATSQRLPDLLTSQIHVLDVATCNERLVAGAAAWETGPRWLPDGSGLLMITDQDGWFHVVRVSADGRKRTALTAGSRDHGEPGGGWGYVPLPSPDGRRFAYVQIRDGFVDLLVGDLSGNAGVGAAGGRVRASGAARSSGSGRASGGTSSSGAAPASTATPASGTPPAVVNPFDGVWMAVGWLPDSSAILAIGRNDRMPDDLWLLPMPEAAGQGAKARQLTHSLPNVVDTAHFASSNRVSFPARDGLRLEGTLYLPATAVGEEATRVPCLIHSHGGPTRQSYRDWMPFRQLVAELGIAFLSVDFRGSSGYGREFRWANRGEWGHADAFDVIDTARWAAAQPWCDGRLAHYGASYGGYMTLCVLTEEPSIWKAGIDLYGDSEIADSYRHGDRPGRIDLERMMGSPDDPQAAPAYRRGSPLYRVDRIEAPLLILHGRKDKRVVPLMTERIVEALEIEGKHYQVHWYDEEPHGWQQRDNRRDAWRRCLEFLRRHLLEQPEED